LHKIFIVSAHTGEGIKNLVNNLRELSKHKKVNNIRRKLTVIGTINSGKSSLINAIIKESKYQSKNVFYKDPFDEDYEKYMKIIKEERSLTKN